MPGAWRLVPGAWCLVPGVRCEVSCLVSEVSKEGLLRGSVIHTGLQSIAAVANGR